MLISKYVIGYSRGQERAFQRLACGPSLCGRGTPCSQALAEVPPSTPMLPVSTLRKNRQRATCHPPRLPDPALRQLCVANLPPQLATSSAIPLRRMASTPDSFAAYSNVYLAYSSFSAASNCSNEIGDWRLEIGSLEFEV